MRRSKQGVFLILLLLSAMLVSEKASALPKAYRVLFVDDGSLGGEQINLYSRIRSIYLGNDFDLGAIEVVSDGAIESFDKQSFAQYDVIVWGYQGGMLSQSATNRMLSSQVPIIVFDDTEFSISQKLGVVSGDIQENDLSAGGFGFLFVDEQNGGLYHSIMSEMVSGCFTNDRMDYYRFKEGAVCEPYPMGCLTAAEAGLYSSLRKEKLNRYSRPLIVDDDPEQVIVFVNDKKRVIVSGTYDLPSNYLWSPSVVFQPPVFGQTEREPAETSLYYYPDVVDARRSLFYRFMKYATAWDTDLASTGDWIKTEGSDQSLLFSPSGENVLQEIDLQVKSRGFDFIVSRYYRSKADDPHSILGPNWKINHDRTISYDTFANSVLVTGPEGGAQAFELVQGKDSMDEISAGERRTFVSTSGVTDIVTYYAPGNTYDVTLTNEDLTGSCSGSLHPTNPTGTAQHREGFLIRDKVGNTAFFARHEIKENVDTWCDGTGNDDYIDYQFRAPVIWGRHDFRTRGGEVKYYKIAYVQDANGNRQNYYYGYGIEPEQEPPSHGELTEKYMPEKHLSCVTDTEGRGYRFGIEWVWNTTRAQDVSENRFFVPFDEEPGAGGYMPYVATSRAYPWLYGVLSTHAPTGIRYDVRNEGWSRAVKMGPYSQVGLLLGAARRTGTTFLYDYYDINKIELPASYRSVEVPRLLSDIWRCDEGGDHPCRHSVGPNSGYITDDDTAIHLKQFDYFTYNYHGDREEFDFPYAFDKMEHRTYKMKLKSIAHFNKQGNVSSKAFFRYSKENQNIPTRDQLKKKYGWLSINKNGAVDTLVYNRRLHLIEHKKSYRLRPNAWQDDEVSICTANDPIDCEGWSWKYESNYDGKVTMSESPSGIKTYHEHGYAAVLAFSSFSKWDWESMDDWLARFWKTWWYLRYYLDNEVMTTRQKGAKWEATATNYEPIYNQPLSVSNLWIEYDVITFGSGLFSFQVTVPTLKWQADKWYRYDYMESGGDQSASARLAQMNISQALLNPMGFWSVWLSGLPYNECTDAAASPGSLPSWNTNAGNLVCEIKPQTTGEGYSQGRNKAYAYFDYDEFGRQTYIKDFSGRVTVQDYGCLDSIGASDFGGPCYYAGQHTAMEVRRLGIDGQDPAIETWYEYNGRGLNVRKVLDVDENDYIVTQFARNQWGWLTAMAVDGVNGREAYEEYTHDALGNVIRVETDRLCGDTSCEHENAVGDSITRLMGYDNQNRLLWECKEVEQYSVASIPNGDFICGEIEYNADDLLAKKTVYEQCTSIGTFEDRPSCDAGDLMYAAETNYDGRRLYLEERRVNREDDARVYRRYHNQDGQLAAVRDPDSNGDGEGEWSYYAYGPLGRLWRKYENGFATEYEYNGVGSLVRESRGTVPGAAEAGTNIDISMLQLEDPLGELNYIHDERRTLIARSDLQHVIGEIPTVEDHRWTYFSYDQDDRLGAEVRDYAGQPVYTLTEYDTYGRVQTVMVGHSGIWTGYVRDNMGRVLQETTAWMATDGSADHEIYKSYAYNAADQIVAASVSGTDSETCLDGVSNDTCHVTFSDYDGFGQLDRFVDAKGQVTSYARDGQGNVLAKYEDDDLGVDDIQVAATFDGLGNVLTRTDALGNVMTYTRNGFGELVAIMHPDGEYEKVFTLNNEGAIKGIQHIHGSDILADITMDLDKHNRPLDVRVNGELAQSYTYNALGNMEWSVDYNLGLRSVMSHSDRTVVVNRTWDTFGNLSSDEVNGEASTATFERGRQESLTSPAGIATNITYDHYAPFGYRDLPSQVTSSHGGDSNLVVNYDWHGPRLTRHQRTLGNESNSLSTSQTFDGFGNVATRADSLSTGSVLSDFTYDYNYNKRLEFEDATDDATDGDYNDVEYTLDYLDRVKGFDNDDLEMTYTLDQANNIVDATMDTGAGVQNIGMDISEDGLNKLDGMDVQFGSQIGYAYDKRGNLVFRGEAYGDGNWKVRVTLFDRLGRLFSAHNVEDGSSTLKAAFYKYDALGRRTGKVFMQAPLDAQQPLTEPTPQVLSLTVPPQIYDDILNLAPNYLNTAEVTETVTFNLYGDDVLEEIHEYTDPEINDQLIAIHHDPTSIDRYNRLDVYHYDNGVLSNPGSISLITDIRNNVVGILDHNGLLSMKIVYDLHGNAAYCIPTTPEWTCSLDPATFDIDQRFMDMIPYRFSGRRYDSETDLYYYRTRYYSSEMGRFISLDTIGIWGDLNNYGNGYAYSGNMANSLVDPWGMEPPLHGQSYWDFSGNAGAIGGVQITTGGEIYVYIGVAAATRGTGIMVAPGQQPKKGFYGFIQGSVAGAGAQGTLYLGDEFGPDEITTDDLGLEFGGAPAPGGGVGFYWLMSGKEWLGFFRDLRDFFRDLFGLGSADEDDPAPGTTPPAPPANQQSDSSDDTSEDDDSGDLLIDDCAPDSMMAPDEHSMGLDQLKELLKSGRIKPKDSPRKFLEYNWEYKIQKLIWELSKQEKLKKKPLLGSDDGKFYFKEPLRDPNPWKYYNALNFRNPGNIDPLPPGGP